MTMERNAHFLTLPERPTRPRQTGLTHVIDKGLTLAQAAGMLEIAGDYVDIVKLGWGSSYITGSLHEKLALYRGAGVEVVLGGTFFEACLLQGRLEEWREFIGSLGLGYVEISDGIVEIPTETKLEWISRMSADFTVLSEVGSKDNEVVIAPSRWVASIQEELNAGSWKVITEARESGTAGIFRGDGEVRMGLIEEIVTAISPDKLIFEAPQKAQQVWFIQTLGSNVSVGNIPPDEVLPLESLRLGLRADTLREIHGGRETD